jgi:hypothetical protein
MKHIATFLFLLLFGVMIEGAQDISRMFHVRHGRFDIADIRANITGLIAFSVCWFNILFTFHNKPVYGKN